MQCLVWVGTVLPFSTKSVLGLLGLNAHLDVHSRVGCLKCVFHLPLHPYFVSVSGVDNGESTNLWRLN